MSNVKGYRIEREETTEYQAEADYREYKDCLECDTNYCYKVKENAPGFRNSTYFNCPKCKGKK